MSAAAQATPGAPGQHLERVSQSLVLMRRSVQVRMLATAHPPCVHGMLSLPAMAADAVQACMSCTKLLFASMRVTIVCVCVCRRLLVLLVWLVPVWAHVSLLRVQRPQRLVWRASLCRTR